MMRLSVIFLLASLLSISLSGCGLIMVGGTATAAGVVHDRRTAGTVVEDQAIEFKAYEVLRGDVERMSNANVSVTSYNGRVLLSGQVPDPRTKEWVEAKVAEVDKVREVFNELTVSPPSPMASRTNDAWITTVTKTSLVQVSGLPDFDPTRVKVVTERGVVYLMGLVTPAEGEASASVARHVSGVQKVVKLFEYT